jgi:hypothetical protein
MPLQSGTLLGPYEILAPVGAGGMGDVYKARDTRLNRLVAVKLSKEQFSERFEREARAIAALNHPHICQIYDVGPNYLVMEYIEGAPVVSQKKPQPMPLPTGRYVAMIASGERGSMVWVQRCVPFRSDRGPGSRDLLERRISGSLRRPCHSTSRRLLAHVGRFRIGDGPIGTQVRVRTTAYPGEIRKKRISDARKSEG